MTLGEIIINCSDYPEFSFVYAKMKHGRFFKDAEAIVLELDENEMERKTTEIAEQKCPGYVYFLEMFIIQEMFGDFKELTEYSSDEKKIERIIYYAEFDA
jgi:hypothetical protein